MEKTTDWILKLKKEGILTEGTKNGENYLHLKTPCEVNITKKAVKQLRDNYDPKFEKGGVLVAKPEKIKGVTRLTIDRIIFLKNVVQDPERSYLPDGKELEQALRDTIYADNDNSLPIRFHTHPTHSENPMMEIINYLYQCNTSQQDQLVSDFPMNIGDLKVLMPRSLILCNAAMPGSMFIGFYNGLIAPIEFAQHRSKKIKEAMDSIMESVTEWAKEGNNKWWLIGGGAAVVLLLFTNPKVVVGLLFIIAVLGPMFVNHSHDNPEYFANLSGKTEVTILFPEIF